MINKLNYSNKKKEQLYNFLIKRRLGKNVNTSIVPKILNDIKKKQRKSSN